jgi:hypothetical protein
VPDREARIEGDHEGERREALRHGHLVDRQVVHHPDRLDVPGGAANRATQIIAHRGV